MKKLLLSISLMVAGASSLYAQTCTPGSAYPGATWADTIYGAYPDTIENFPPAAQGVAYSTDLTFKVPTTVTANLDPTGAFVGSPIVQFVVDNVTGLPAGLNYACNISSCTYPGGSLGCANLYGTPTQTGTFPVVIAITATVIINVPIIGPTPVDQATSFTGYKIIVGTAGIVEAVLNPIAVHPNPASDKITITGLDKQLNVTSLVITNMEGKVVKTVNVTSATMDVNLDGVDSGIYFVVVNHDAGTETVKFIKE